MINKLKSITKQYFRKKWYSILSDFVFVILIALLVIPSTRIPVASFFIKLTSLPPSTLDINEQTYISDDSKAWILMDMSGNQVNFGTLNDKPVFLNIWATWCPPCIAELPGIADLHKQYGDKVNFVLVSSESRAKVRGFAKGKKMESLPFYQNEYLPSDFYSESVPTTFIIDTNGKIVLAKKGVARWNSGKVEELLNSLTSK